MNFDEQKIKISVNDIEYSFHYASNENSTFEDLLEYFSYLVPYLNICQCYKFQIYNEDKKSDDKPISLDSKIKDFSYNLDKLIIKKDNNKCEHVAKNELLFSKQKIISYFQTHIEKLSEEIKALKRNNLIFNQPQFVNDFYDTVVHIDSIKGIKKGWKIDMKEIGKQNYEKYKNKKIFKIGVIGNANKGKSFILSKIYKIMLPSGLVIKTEGLSIKYAELMEYRNRPIVLLDSAGIETPLLESERNILEGKDKNEIFGDKCRDKLISGLFLQNYIIHNSDVLITVVDCLSLSEQKFLIKLEKDIEKRKYNKPVIIIHNLKTYTTVKHVHEYIENTLLKSASFSLEKQITLKGDNFVLYQKNVNEDSLGIFHLIYANENSEAGKYFNEFTLNFIENTFQTVTNISNFDLIETIKKRFIEFSNEILYKTEKGNIITIDDFDRESEPNLIKLKSEKEITLKKCLIDELGYTKFISRGFEPKYNAFKKDNKIIIGLEIPGNMRLTSEILYIGEYCKIRLCGEKKKDIIPEKLEDNIYNKREFGNFVLDIPFSARIYHISPKKPVFYEEKGVQYIEYELEKQICRLPPGDFGLVI